MLSKVEVIKSVIWTGSSLGKNKQWESWPSPDFGSTDFRWIKYQAENGREVKAGDRNFLKSCIFFMIKSEPPMMSKYTRIVTIFLLRGFYSIIWNQPNFYSKSLRNYIKIHFHCKNSYLPLSKSNIIWVVTFLLQIKGSRMTLIESFIYILPLKTPIPNCLDGFSASFHILFSETVTKKNAPWCLSSSLPEAHFYSQFSNS